MAAQVLPSSHGLFGQRSSPFGSDMFAGFQGALKWPGACACLTLLALGFGDINADAFEGYQPNVPTQQQYITAPQLLSSDESSRRAPSLSPNQMRIPPRRDRTPIQHHHRSIPRARSHSRSEMLLAYASEQAHPQQPQQQQASQAAMTVVPSQSAPTTPQIYPTPPTYTAPAAPGTGSFGAGGGYFPASMQQPDAQPMPDFGFPADAQFQEYYPIARSASGSAGMPSMNPQDTVYVSAEGQHAAHPLTSMPAAVASFPPIHTPLESTPGELEIMSPRPKPQCWDHGCNGRQFSTFSNLLRHQREKSGSAMKAVCPYCGTEFTRTTARNGHMYGGKCKGRPDRESSASSSATGDKKA